MCNLFTFQMEQKVKTDAKKVFPLNIRIFRNDTSAIVDPIYFSALGLLLFVNLATHQPCQIDRLPLRNIWLFIIVFVYYNVHLSLVTRELIHKSIIYCFACLLAHIMTCIRYWMFSTNSCEKGFLDFLVYLIDVVIPVVVWGIFIWTISIHLEDINRYGSIFFLDTRQYSKPKNPINTSHTDCCICTDEYQQGDLTIELPCSHRYHVKCLEDWFNRQKYCPLCDQSYCYC